MLPASLLMLFNLKLLTLLLLVSLSASGQSFLANCGKAITVTAGNFLSINTSSSGASGAQCFVRATIYGAQVDSVDGTGSEYSTFGTNIVNNIIDCVLTANANYTASPATNSHGGIGLRFQDGNNWATLCMLNTVTGDLDINDRVAGLETWNGAILTTKVIIGGRYRLKIDNSSGNTSVVNLWNFNTGAQLLTNYTLTMTTGVPSTGYSFVHTYANQFTVNSLFAFDASGNCYIGAPQTFISSAAAAGFSGSINSASAATLYCDGTHGSANTWSSLIGPITTGDCTIKGVLNRGSGRIVGITTHNGPKGNGDLWYYDNNNNNLRYGTNLASVVVVSSSSSVTLSANTDYPFTFTARGTSYTFTVNGVTLSITSSTNPSGFFGTMGFQSNPSFHDINVYP